MPQPLLWRRGECRIGPDRSHHPRLSWSRRRHQAGVLCDQLGRPGCVQKQLRGGSACGPGRTGPRRAKKADRGWGDACSTPPPIQGVAGRKSRSRICPTPSERALRQSPLAGGSPPSVTSRRRSSSRRLAWRRRRRRLVGELGRGFCQSLV